MFVTSRYNLSVPLPGARLLYNSMSGALVEVNGPDVENLAKLLDKSRTPVELDHFPPDLAERLLIGGFLKPLEVNELEEIRTRYRRARIATPMVVTITTTMDCNLGCYYCYEDRSGHRLADDDILPILNETRKRLEAGKHHHLHVSWYGGEPMLNVSFLEKASAALQKMCEESSIQYASSIISNGTRWPTDVSEFLSRHKIGQVQISFDGMREHHNKRRHYRKDFSPSANTSSSFDEAVKLVDQLIDSVHVDIRFNIDRDNREDLLPFIHFAQERGWFLGKFLPTIQPARISAYSDRSAFMKGYQLSLEEYDRARTEVRAMAGIDIPVDESEVPHGYPHPRNSVCAALANSSIVIGADKSQYRCGLQVGERARVVGSLGGGQKGVEQGDDPNNQVEYTDINFWDSFDPTLQPTCSKCTFLPICWGGCPKKHLEGDREALLEQGAYWRANLARLIAARTKITFSEAHVFTDSEQFKDCDESVETPTCSET